MLQPIWFLIIAGLRKVLQFPSTITQLAAPWILAEIMTTSFGTEA